MIKIIPAIDAKYTHHLHTINMYNKSGATAAAAAASNASTAAGASNTSTAAAAAAAASNAAGASGTASGYDQQSKYIFMHASIAPFGGPPHPMNFAKTAKGLPTHYPENPKIPIPSIGVLSGMMDTVRFPILEGEKSIALPPPQNSTLSHLKLALNQVTRSFNFKETYLELSHRALDRTHVDMNYYIESLKSNTHDEDLWKEIWSQYVYINVRIVALSKEFRYYKMMKDQIIARINNAEAAALAAANAAAANVAAETELRRSSFKRVPQPQAPVPMAAAMAPAGALIALSRAGEILEENQD